MEKSEILERAAEIIEERGWFQGDYEGPNGEVCLLGGLRAAMGLPLSHLASGTSPLFTEIAEAVRDTVGLTPFMWNDILGRTSEQVQDALITTAKKFRNEGH